MGVYLGVGRLPLLDWSTTYDSNLRCLRIKLSLINNQFLKVEAS